jgi:hypothetical protein
MNEDEEAEMDRNGDGDDEGAVADAEAEEGEIEDEDNDNTFGEKNDRIGDDNGNGPVLEVIVPSHNAIDGRGDQLEIAAANKRISNILAKVKGDINADVDSGLLQEDAEKALAEVLAGLESKLTPLFAQGDYEAALFELASLQTPVDAFFDNVMVMAEDEAVKQNRLAILNRLRNLFLQVADVSVL